MRKTPIIAAGAAVALVGAAVAMATAFTATGVSATTATFAAGTAADVKSRSCEGADGKKFTITRGHYSGGSAAFAGAPALDGPVNIRAATTYSTSDGLGYVEGSFRVKDDDTRLNGAFWGTLKGTDLVGYITAKSRGHHAKVVGNLSAKFDPATGFTSGLIGSTSSTSVLAVLAGPACKGKKDSESRPKPEPKPRHAKRAEVYGEVTVVSDTAITVKAKRGPATATCTRDATSPVTTGYVVGDKVEMKCEYIGTTWTLRKLEKRT